MCHLVFFSHLNSKRFLIAQLTVNYMCPLIVCGESGEMKLLFYITPDSILCMPLGFSLLLPPVFSLPLPQNLLPSWQLEAEAVGCDYLQGKQAKQRMY